MNQNSILSSQPLRPNLLAHSQPRYGTQTQEHLISVSNAVENGNGSIEQQQTRSFIRLIADYALDRSGVIARSISQIATSNQSRQIGRCILNILTGIAFVGWAATFPAGVIDLIERNGGATEHKLKVMFLVASEDPNLSCTMGDACNAEVMLCTGLWALLVGLWSLFFWV